jgi:hypothetical protein
MVLLLVLGLSVRAEGGEPSFAFEKYEQGPLIDPPGSNTDITVRSIEPRESKSVLPPFTCSARRIGQTPEST